MYMYIPFKSAHPRHTIKNYVVDELNRYVRMKMKGLIISKKIRNSFFLRMRKRGFKQNKLSHCFAEVKYSSRALSALTREIFVIAWELNQKDPKQPLFVQLCFLPKLRRKKDCAVSFQNYSWKSNQKLIRLLVKKVQHFQNRKK